MRKKQNFRKYELAHEKNRINWKPYLFVELRNAGFKMALNLLHLVLLAQVLHADWLVEASKLLIGPDLGAAAHRVLPLLCVFGGR
jgi:hypothetical protein